MKKAIIKRMFVWGNATLTPLVGAAVMAGYDKLPDGMKAFTDPYALTAIAMGLVAGGMSLALSKWQGIPVEELQSWLAEKGLYAGRIDGLKGDQTDAALARAIEDPEINDYTPIKKAKAVIRPMGGKIQ